MRKLRLEKVGQCSRWHKMIVSEIHFNLKFPHTAQCWQPLLFISSPSTFSAAQQAQGCQALRANVFKSLTSLRETGHGREIDYDNYFQIETPFLLLYLVSRFDLLLKQKKGLGRTCPLLLILPLTLGFSQWPSLVLPFLHPTPLPASLIFRHLKTESSI